MHLMYYLRGLKDIKIGWKHCDGVYFIEEWAKLLAGYWRLARDDPGEGVAPVDADVGTLTSTSYIHWKAGSRNTTERLVTESDLTVEASIGGR